MSVTKPLQIRIRVTDEDMPVMQDLAGNILSITDVASLLLSAAIDAVRHNGGNVCFPPKFVVGVSGETEILKLNETKRVKRV